MTPLQLFSNNAVSLLQNPISATDTSLTVMAGYGDMYPQPTGDGSDYFLVTLENQAATLREIIRVTARSGDVLSGLIRGREGYDPLSWTASSHADTLVDHRITAETLYKVNNPYFNPGFNALTDLEKVADYLLHGNPTSGGQVVDGPFTLIEDTSTTKLALPSNYQPGTSSVFVGGLRQKRGVDFLETGPSELTLQFAHTQALVDAGVNIVVDYVVA